MVALKYSLGNLLYCKAHMNFKFLTSKIPGTIFDARQILAVFFQVFFFQLKYKGVFDIGSCR